MKSRPRILALLVASAAALAAIAGGCGRNEISTVLAPSGVLDPGTRMLQKPFATGELLRAVRELLDARG